MKWMQRTHRHCSVFRPLVARVLLLVSLASLAVGTAHAEPAAASPADQSHLEWYTGRIILSDVLSIAATGAAAKLLPEDDVGLSLGVLALGLYGAAPLVHWSKTTSTKALESFGLRFGLAAVGGGIGWLLDGRSCSCVLPVATAAGVMLGTATGVLADYIFVAVERVPGPEPAVAILPTVTFIAGRPAAGVAGRF